VQWGPTVPPRCKKDGKMLPRFRLVFAVAVALFCMASPAAATLLDPATLQIGTTVRPSGSDPNRLDSNPVYMYQNSNGADTLANPVFMILAVPNLTSPATFFAVNPILTVTYINPAPGGTTTPGTGTKDASTTAHPIYGYTGGFYAGDLTATQGGDIYSVMKGLDTPFDKSNNFTNLAGSDKSINGITATKFSIYVFDLNSTAGLGPNGAISVKFNSALIPTGTYMVGFGEDTTHLYDTPFTQAGLTTGSFGGGQNPTPEPASLVVMGGVTFGGLLFGVHRRFRKQRALASA